MEWKKQNKFKSQFVNGVTSFFKYVFLLILAMAIGVVCLVGAYMIPLSDQTDNVLESVRILEEEGWYPVGRKLSAYCNDSFLSALLGWICSCIEACFMCF